jgi:hypothetical protein
MRALDRNYRGGVPRGLMGSEKERKGAKRSEKGSFCQYFVRCDSCSASRFVRLKVLKFRSFIFISFYYIYIYYIYKVLLHMLLCTYTKHAL